MAIVTGLRTLRRACVVGSMLCLPLMAACAATTPEGAPATGVPTCSTVTVAPTQPTQPAPSNHVPRGGMRPV